MKNQEYLFLLITICWCVNVNTFDLTQVDKHGLILSKNQCNMDTTIDFSFSPNSLISNCTVSGCVLVIYGFIVDWR